MSVPLLQIIIASTRPGRVGLPVAQWFVDLARTDGRFEIDLVDLAEVALPFMDEPNHPRLRQYTHEHTLAWSARVDRADAYVFVTPEYNHGLTAPLKNAIDFLYEEWLDKPVGFVSYGGIAAGTRSVQMLKQVVAALKMVAVLPAVNIAYVATLVDTQRVLQPTEALQTGAAALLDELARMTPLLQSLRG